MSKKPTPSEPSGESPAAPDAAVTELRQQLAQELPPPPPRPATPPPGAPGDQEAAIGELESTLDSFAANPEKMGELTEQEWADLWELLFGLTADGLGKHWEIDHKRATRLGAYTKKTLDRYGVGTESFAKHIPAIALGLLLVGTIYPRWKEDQRLRHPTPVLKMHQDGAPETAP